MNKKKVSIILGIMCCLLTIGICIQIKTVKSTNEVVNTNFQENELRGEVLKIKEKYDNLVKELEKAEENLEDEREKATSNDDGLAQMEEEIKQGNKMLGLSEVTGQGVIITLQDSQTVTNSALDLNDLVVHDMDVLSVINELKNAGAEAISINDQRLTPTTAIICDGNVIEINGEKVGAPFQIKAIGLPEQLAALSRPGGYLSLLEEYGIVTKLEKSNHITIPKYSGALDFKYAHTIE